uniref:Uncharacterized protein n=1 Tax=Anopheles merus TaxID=30066 RepID=A0A182VFJ2_ANOME
MPKKRRRVLPVEQPRRKRDMGVANRRVNALKHQHTQPTHPAIFKDAFGGAKIGHVNGVNVIGLTLQGPSVPGLAVLKPPAVLQQAVERRESRPEEMIPLEPKVTLQSDPNGGASGNNTPGDEP